MAYRGPHPMPVASGFTGKSNITGIVSGNGTVALTGSAITQYDNLVGGSANTISTVAPVLSGWLYTSFGSGNNPGYVPGYSAGNSVVVLSQQTASSSSNIQFKSVITSTYNTYKLVIYGMYPGTSNSFLKMLISTNNGSSYISSNYHANTLYYPYSSNSATNTTNGSYCPLSGGISSTTSNPAFSAMIDLYINQSTDFAMMGTCVWSNNSNVMQFGICQASNSSNTMVNAIEFTMSSGNIASGTFTLWGVLP